MPTILVVDDDPHLREVVDYALSREGFTVRQAADGAEAIRVFRTSTPDLVVLDVKMPEVDGLQVCRTIRESSKVPIVFLSTRGDEIDRVLGLELGGDDYLPKPFSTRELVSRVRAVLRRTSAAPATDDELIVGELRFVPGEHRLYARGTAVELTVTEYRLLYALASRPGRVFQRDELVERAYEGPHHVSGRTLDSHVRNVRGKLRATGVDPLETVHGLGYRMKKPA